MDTHLDNDEQHDVNSEYELLLFKPRAQYLRSGTTLSVPLCEYTSLHGMEVYTQKVSAET